MSFRVGDSTKSGGLRLVDTNEIREEVKSTSGASSFVSGSAPTAGAAPAWRSNPMAGARRAYAFNEIPAEKRAQYLAAAERCSADLCSELGDRFGSEVAQAVCTVIEDALAAGIDPFARA